jgi:predicted component of type VI protein secretion system
MLRQFGDPTFSYDVHLVLKAVEINPLCLSGSAPCPIRLGLDSFLVADTEVRDRSDMRYCVTPMAPLPPLAARAASRRNPS